MAKISPFYKLFHIPWNSADLLDKVGLEGVLGIHLDVETYKVFETSITDKFFWESMFTLRYWKIDKEKRRIKKREVRAGRVVFKTPTYDLTEQLREYRKEIEKAGRILKSAQETVYVMGKDPEFRDLLGS